jgi:hypothetical protein
VLLRVGGEHTNSNDEAGGEKDPDGVDETGGREKSSGWSAARVEVKDVRDDEGPGSEVEGEHSWQPDEGSPQCRICPQNARGEKLCRVDVAFKELQKGLVSELLKRYRGTHAVKDDPEDEEGAL